MTKEEKEKQEIFEATLKIGQILSVKGSMENDPQFELLGHVILVSCKAISTKIGCVFLQHHINEFVDSIMMSEKKLKTTEHLCNEERITQN